MKNYYSYYAHFTEEQFAADEYFKHWVIYADSEKNEFWETFVNLFPNQQQNVLQARKIVATSFNTSSFEPLSNKEKQALKQAIYSKINQQANTTITMRSKSKWMLKAAAIVTGILLTTAYLLNNEPKPEKLIAAQTGNRETREIVLADSTVIILNANSSITYKSSINALQNREVYLQGNAYFKVKKKANHSAFTVHTNTIAVTVLGTEFNVDARNKATAVVLTTGKVKLSMNENTRKTMFMQPGDKVEVDTLQMAMVKSAADTLLYKAWTEGNWNFSSTSLQEISKLIHEYYGIETVFPDEKTRHLKITAVIPVTNLGQFINILSKTLDIHISEINNQLEIRY